VWGVQAPQCKNSYFTKMCSGSEAGSYLRLIDFVYHSTLGLRVIKKKKHLRIDVAELVEVVLAVVAARVHLPPRDISSTVFGVRA